MLSINISELVLTIISFFLLLFLLNKFLYTPVLKFMRERQARIDASNEAACLAQSEADELSARIDGEKAARRDEAKALIAAQRAEESKAEGDYAKALQAQSAEDRRASKARIDAEAEAISAQLDAEKDALARTLAERLIGRG